MRWLIVRRRVQQHAASAPTAEPTAHELMLVDGDILTMDPAHPHATAVAVATATGSSRSAATTTIRALHRPGRADHRSARPQRRRPAWSTRTATSTSSARTSRTSRSAARRPSTRPPRVIADAAKTRPASEWLHGRGWDQNRWPGQQFPTKASLDAVTRSPGAARARRRSRDLGQLEGARSSRASRAATPDPAGGKIVRDAHGEPTGVLVDNATGARRREACRSRRPSCARAPDPRRREARDRDGHHRHPRDGHRRRDRRRLPRARRRSTSCRCASTRSCAAIRSTSSARDAPPGAARRAGSRCAA